MYNTIDVVTLNDYMIIWQFGRSFGLHRACKLQTAMCILDLLKVQKSRTVFIKRVKENSDFFLAEDVQRKMSPL